MKATIICFHITLLGAITFGLTACGPYLDQKPEMQIGSTLPISVELPDGQANGATGTVYYRSRRDADYRSKPLVLRGDTLTAMLPTQDLRVNESMYYYATVQGTTKPFTLGSAADPYSTKFVSHRTIVGHGLDIQADYSDNKHEIRFNLNSEQTSIDRAKLYYHRPGVRGEIKIAMDAIGSNTFTVVIPKRDVSAGEWRYYVEAHIDGEVYRVPSHGLRSFQVTKASDAN